MAAHVTGAGTDGSRPPRVKGGRLPFRLKVVLVWIGVILVLALFFKLAKFDTAFMRQNAVFILKGIWVTLLISLSGIALAVTLALFGALGRLSRNPIAFGVSGFYTSFFRGTPLIVQLFLIYLAVPQIGSGLQLNVTHPHLFQYFVLSAVFAGILGLGLNYGAYMTEIFRAGILAVGPGQTEAADALGMSYRQRMRRVVLPQAFKVIIPPTGNEFIAMTKDSALIAFLGTPVAWWDVFQRARIVGNENFRNLEALLLAAGVYWGLTMILTFFQTRLERRISKGYVRQAAVVASSRRDRWLGGRSQPVPVPPVQPQLGQHGQTISQQLLEQQAEQAPVGEEDRP